MIRVLIMLLAALAVPVSVAAADLNETQLVRYHELTADLRCLICQNRSIAESDAPLAKDLRAIVEKQIAAGRSDTQIKQYLVERYGEWVLYDPPFQMQTWILWLGPFVLLALGLVIVVFVMRRRTDASAPTLDRERLAQVLGDDQAPDSLSHKDSR